jgi:hypothetical protein
VLPGGLQGGLQAYGFGLFGYVALFVACGAATIPLTLGIVRMVAGASWSQRLERALSWSMTVWILGVMIFYAGMVLIERQRPCELQRTNQITDACKAYLDSLPR